MTRGSDSSKTRLLTMREQRVLECAAKGQSDKQIAESLSMSPHTVDTHWRRIRRKLGVPNRTAAVAAWLCQI